MGMFRRRHRTDDQHEPDLVELPVGYDRTAASMIVARCEAEGIPVRLLTMDDNGLSPGIAALAEHRVIVRLADRDRVQTIVHRS